MEQKLGDETAGEEDIDDAFLAVRSALRSPEQRRMGLGSAKATA